MAGVNRRLGSGKLGRTMAGEALWRGVGGAVYGLGVLAWAGAVWFLPSGNVLWPAVVLAGFGVPVVSRVVGGARGGRGWGLVGGVWWGMAVFSGGVRFLGLPYRPEVLHGLLLLGAGLGLVLTAVGYGGGRAWGVALGVWLAVAMAGWLGLYLQGVAPFVS